MTSKRKFSTDNDAEVSQIAYMERNISAESHQPLHHPHIDSAATSSELRAPTQQADRHIQKLKDEIRSVYGPNSTVYVTVLPSPEPSPQKKRFRANSADLAPFPPRYFDSYLAQSSSPGKDDRSLGTDTEYDYESSYNSSEPFSPTSSSPATVMSRANSNMFEQTPEVLSPAALNKLPVYAFSRAASSTAEVPNLAARAPRRKNASLDITSCMEYTGVSEEDVQAYISEQNAETNRWSCLFPECKKTFGRRENIKSHVQTHLGDRQYKCKNCIKRFVRQHDLKRHAKIHSGDKPYKCPCGAGFARQDALTRHRQRGVCIGGFPNVNRRQSRRGRPRKKRIEDDPVGFKVDTSSNSAVAPRSNHFISSDGKCCQTDQYGACPHQGPVDEQSLLSSYDMLSDRIISSPIDVSKLLSTPCINQAPVTYSFGQSPATSARNGYAREHNSTETSLSTLTSEATAQTPPISPFSKQHSFEMDQQCNDKHQLYVTEITAPMLANPFTTPPHSPFQSDLDMHAVKDQASLNPQNNDFVEESHLATMLCDPINLLSDGNDILAEENRLKSSANWMTPW